jgi:nicotinamidase-related amidase
MKSALIVIDVQESFTRRPYFSAADVPAYLAAQNRLIEGFEAQGLPIVRVFHVSPGGDAGDAFALASGLVKPLEGLRPFAEPPKRSACATAQRRRLNSGRRWPASQGLRSGLSVSPTPSCRRAGRPSCCTSWRPRPRR